MNARAYCLIALLFVAAAMRQAGAADDKAESLDQRRQDARAEVDQQMQGLTFLGEHDLKEVVSFSVEGTKLVPSTAMPATGPYFGAVKIRQLPGDARVRVQYIGGQRPIGGLDNGRRFFQMDYFDLTVPGTVEVHDQILSGPEPVNVAEDTEFLDGRRRTVQLVQAGPEGPEALRLYVQDFPVSDSDKITEYKVFAPSVTALCWDHPREADEYLRPMFRRLGQEIVLFGVDPKAAWEVVGGDWQPDPATVAAADAIVARLGAESFEQREAATADLRKLGEPAAVYLMNAPLVGLSLEQEMRVNLFLVPYRPLTSDDAARLGHEESFLIDCLYTDDPTLRRLVLKRLERIAGKPIDFDAGVSGDAAIDAVAALRDRIDATSDTQAAQ